MSAQLSCIYRVEFRVLQQICGKRTSGRWNSIKPSVRESEEDEEEGAERDDMVRSGVV